MNKHLTQLCALSLIIAVPAFAGGDKKAPADPRKSLPAPVAVYSRGPADDVILNYSAMLTAYIVSVTLDQPIIVEIGYIANQSGVDKEVPADLSQSVRSVLDRIGAPFETFRTWPSIVGTPYGNIVAGGKQSMGGRQPTAQDEPPTPNFRINGVITEFKETIADNRNHKLDATFGGGHTSVDIQAELQKIRTVTTLSVSLTLERRNGTAVRGGTVDYKIDIAKDEKNRSIGLFVGGSGIGVGRKLTASQDTADLIREALSMAIVHMTAMALQVPYDRCSPSFDHNEFLDKSVRAAFAGLGDGALEENIRRYLFLGAARVNGSGPITASDRDEIAAELKRRGISNDYAGRVGLVTALWRELDYKNAALKVGGMLVARQRGVALAAERDAAKNLTQPQPAPVGPVSAQTTPGPSAAEYGWQPFVHFVTLDFSGIADAAVRNVVVRAASACEGCVEIRNHKNPAFVGLRVFSSAGEVEKALRRARLNVRWNWVDSQQRLIVLPAAPGGNPVQAAQNAGGAPTS
jgi:hypothetical protein